MAFGSGAARALSQIGTLLWLKENNIAISCLSGCSMGAVVGGFLAAGYTPEFMRDIALGVRKKNLIRYLKPSFDGSSIFRGDGITLFLAEYLGDIRIEDLSIPFACVASDLNSGEEIIFKEGSLVKAVRSSAGLPGIFPPEDYLGRELVDGGLVNPVPLDLAFELGADFVIGVNVSKPVYRKRVSVLTLKTSGRKAAEPKVSRNIEKGPRPFTELASRLQRTGKRRLPIQTRRMFYNIMADSLTIFSSRVLSLKRINAGPHILIEPEVGAFKSFDFDRAEELIETGYRAMESRKSEIFKLLGL
jgi:NTE family protein